MALKLQNKRQQQEEYMTFRDRESSAWQLLDKLHHYKDQNVIVAGIPRGAMPMAKIIAEGLKAELTAVLVHKIPSPQSKEFAIGSVGISGHVWKDTYVEEYGIPDSYIQNEAEQQLKVLKKRQREYGLKEVDMKDRTVIIVDDGIATGATTMSAVHEVRVQGAARIVLAAAVASVSAAHKLEHLVDELVLLDTPSGFFSVGQFFYSFPQVTDAEVIKILRGTEEQYKVA